MIRQVLQSYSVAGKWRVLFEHSGLTNFMQGFGWAIAKALAEAGAEISLGVWVRHPNVSSHMSGALPAALSQPQMMHRRAGPGSQHFRDQPEARQV